MLPQQPPSSDKPDSVPLDPEFLALLACPLCAERPPLRFEAAEQKFYCDRCGHVYPLTDGLPDLRPTEAEIAGIAVPEKEN
jgi:uncharacterized protein YbaR (Trm112 family)